MYMFGFGFWVFWLVGCGVFLLLFVGLFVFVFLCFVGFFGVFCLVGFWGWGGRGGGFASLF